MYRVKIHYRAVQYSRNENNFFIHFMSSFIDVNSYSKVLKYILFFKFGLKFINS